MLVYRRVYIYIYKPLIKYSCCIIFISPKQILRYMDRTGSLGIQSPPENGNGTQIHPNTMLRRWLDTQSSSDKVIGSPGDVCMMKIPIIPRISNGFSPMEHPSSKPAPLHDERDLLWTPILPPNRRQLTPQKPGHVWGDPNMQCVFFRCSHIYNNLRYISIIEIDRNMIVWTYKNSKNWINPSILPTPKNQLLSMLHGLKYSFHHRKTVGYKVTSSGDKQHHTTAKEIAMSPDSKRFIDVSKYYPRSSKLYPHHEVIYHYMGSKCEDLWLSPC